MIRSRGGKELGEFQRQSGAFADTLIEYGNRVDKIFIETHRHFEMGAELYNSGGPIFAAIAYQLGVPWHDVIHSPHRLLADKVSFG